MWDCMGEDVCRRASGRANASLSFSLSLYIYIYMYIYSNSAAEMAGRHINPQSIHAGWFCFFTQIRGLRLGHPRTDVPRGKQQRTTIQQAQLARPDVQMQTHGKRVHLNDCLIAIISVRPQASANKWLGDTSILSQSMLADFASSCRSEDYDLVILGPMCQQASSREPQFNMHTQDQTCNAMQTHGKRVHLNVVDGKLMVWLPLAVIAARLRHNVKCER